MSGVSADYSYNHRGRLHLWLLGVILLRKVALCHRKNGPDSYNPGKHGRISTVPSASAAEGKRSLPQTSNTPPNSPSPSKSLRVPFSNYFRMRRSNGYILECKAKQCNVQTTLQCFSEEKSRVYFCFLVKHFSLMNAFDFVFNGVKIRCILLETDLINRALFGHFFAYFLICYIASHKSVHLIWHTFVALLYRFTLWDYKAFFQDVVCFIYAS